jgi:hypothetical protein
MSHGASVFDALQDARRIHPAEGKNEMAETGPEVAAVYINDKWHARQ